MTNLKELFDQHTGTKNSWLVRRLSTGNAFGGGENTVTGFRTAAVKRQGKGRMLLTSYNRQTIADVDEVIVLTGFRTDLSILTEIRLDLDSVP